MYESITFAEKGSNITFYPYIVFVNPQNIHFKNNIVVSEFCWIHGGIKTVIGNFIHIAPYSSIAGGGVCIMEDFVTASAGVRIITGSELLEGEGLANSAIPAEFRAVERSFVHLEKHSFLATNVIVLPGITIGEGAVIGAGSVVTKDVEPWSINVGSPARSIGKRPYEKIKTLEEKLYETSGIHKTDINEFLPLKTIHHCLPTY